MSQGRGLSLQSHAQGRKTMGACERFFEAMYSLDSKMTSLLFCSTPFKKSGT